MKVSQILKTKGPEVFTIGAEKTLFNATEILVKNNIGVLLVLDEKGKINGILSERDIIRVAYNKPEAWKEVLVQDTMTKDVLIVEAEDELEYVERIFSNNKIRHLPVVNDHILVGMISIGDIVKSQLSRSRADNKHLMDYISG